MGIETLPFLFVSVLPLENFGADFRFSAQGTFASHGNGDESAF